MTNKIIISLFITLLMIFTGSKTGYSQYAVNIIQNMESIPFLNGWDYPGFEQSNLYNITMGGQFSARSSQGAPPISTYLKSPHFRIFTGEKIVISCNYLRSNNPAPKLEIWVKGSVINEKIFVDTVRVRDQWFNKSITFTAASNDPYLSIYFYADTEGGSQRLHYDDITIQKSVMINTPPDKPWSLNANAISSNRINLSWADSSFNESKFIIERRTGSNPTWSIRDSVNANVTSYSDLNLLSNTIYTYRIKAVNTTGSSEYSNISSDTTFTATGINEPEAVYTFRLLGNYPNPFNPSTNIKFEIPEAGQSVLQIFDMKGTMLFNKTLYYSEPGIKTVNWNASGIAGGVYFYRVIFINNIKTGKMLLIK